MATRVSPTKKMSVGGAPNIVAGASTTAQLSVPYTP
jgi:hypothetical protein